MEKIKETVVKVEGPMPEKLRKAIENKRDFIKKIQSGEIVFNSKNAKRAF